MTYRHLRNVRGFFSDYYLGSVFGHGDGRTRRRELSDRETDAAYRRFRRLYEKVEGRELDAGRCREVFLRPLFREVLGFHLGGGEEGVHPLVASAEDAAPGVRPLAIVWLGASGEDPDAGRSASRPLVRVQAALAKAGLRHGILATGERLRLVRPAGEGPTGACLEVDLAGLADDEDSESFAVLLRLFSIAAFRPDPSGKTALDRTEEESRGYAEKVSEDLKRAVFASAETLVQGLLDDAEARGEIPSVAVADEPTLRACRDAALLALYRLLFVFYAEARDRRLEDHGLYRASYSAETMREEILASSDREWPANRCSLWQRLRALFRIYDDGLPAISRWEHIPPRGGDLFSAKTPEGLRLDQARLTDTVVARIVQDLSTTAARRGVGRERVSFRELDVESLGAVYEGLLEFEPRVAREPIFEVRVAGRLLALAPDELVRLCAARNLQLHGDAGRLAGTAAAALVPVPEDSNEGSATELDEADEPAAVVGEDAEADSTEEEDEETEGVGRGASVRLVRRIEPGRFHFVPGASRKGSGSFYTPRALVQDLVRHALGPAVEGRNSEEILRLRVLDPACGSAHFLVEAMRFLGAALHRAYAREHPGKGPPEFRPTIGRGWDDDWKTPDAQARASNSEARAWCKRRVAERCLFGVDLNPTAVMLARVALWIESVAGDRPLTYFRHHVRVGNSLLGTWVDRLHRPPLPSMPAAHDPRQMGLFDLGVHRILASAAEVRRLIDVTDPNALRREAIDPESTREQDFKEAQRARAEALLEGVRHLFDLRCAAAFVPAAWGEWEHLCSLVSDPAALASYVADRPWGAEASSVARRERFFHWELEFPEVLLDSERPGFDAILGNPPWDEVRPKKHEFYSRRDVLIRAFTGGALEQRIRELNAAHAGLAAEFSSYSARLVVVRTLLRNADDFPLGEARSHLSRVDLSKYFVDRAARLLRVEGAAGLVVPAILYNGDACIGIRRFLLSGARVERFYGFENHHKRFFPIHASYKFVNLVFRKGCIADGFDAAFMRRDEEELESQGAKPWMVRLTRAEIERQSPETLAFLEYRGPRDQEIVLRMAEGNPTLSGAGPESWEAGLFDYLAHRNIYNATWDRDLFTEPESGELHSPRRVLGEEPPTFDATVGAMRERGYWPVYEGKHIEQFVVGLGTVRWWLSVRQAEAKYGRAPLAGATLVFRETASNTNERTCIASLLPPSSAGVHTLSGMECGAVPPEAALVVLNSLCFDFALRMRAAGTHVSQTYMLPMPVPPASVTARLPRVPSLAVRNGGIQHVTDDRSLWPLIWNANRAVAEAYGLNALDVEHVLAGFDGMRRKRPQFYSYLVERIVAWKAETGRAS